MIVPSEPNPRHRDAMQLAGDGPDAVEKEAAGLDKPSTSTGALGRAGGIGASLLSKPDELRRWWQGLTAVFETNFLVLIASVYFLQGLGAFATFVTKFYIQRSYADSCPCMINDSCGSSIPQDCHSGLALPPAQQSAVLAFASLPWNYKIFYGMFSDFVPIMGSHRRSYIMLSGFVGALGFFGLSAVAGDQSESTSVTTVQWLLLLTNLSTAFCDVCTDALVAANAKMESETGAGDLQSLCWASLAVGGLLSSLLAGNLYDTLAPSVRPCYFLAAFVPTMRLVLASQLNEPRGGKVDLGMAKQQLNKLFKTLGNPGIYRPIAFIFLSHATIPDFSSPQQQYLTSTDNHGFSAGFNNKTFTCAWFAEHDPHCSGHWANGQRTPPFAPPPVESWKTIRVAGSDRPILLPPGYEFVRPRAACKLSASKSFLNAVEACLPPASSDPESVDPLSGRTLAQVCGDVQLGDTSGQDTLTCQAAGCEFHAVAEQSQCLRLQLKSPVPGLDAGAVAAACPLIVGTDRDTRCGELLSSVVASGPAALSQESRPWRVADLCPQQCEYASSESCPVSYGSASRRSHGGYDCHETHIDSCGVGGGDGSSCLAELLAEAWHQCPVSCGGCERTRRGCLEFSDEFMSMLGIISYVGLFLGVSIYNSKCKRSPHAVLLLRIQLVLTAISVSDWVLVSQVNPAEGTVLGIDAHVFGIFGEATDDIAGQIKSMPLLVLAAQVCPAAIEGTLFAFIMSMYNIGVTYGRYFGAWMQDELQMQVTDYSSLATAQALRVVFKLSPLLFLWLVPQENPQALVAEIDRQISDTPSTPSSPKALGPEPSSLASPAGAGAPAVAAWPMLVALLLAQCMPILMESFGWPNTVLAVPVVVLVAVPWYHGIVSRRGRFARTTSHLDEGLTSHTPHEEITSM